MYTHDPRNDIVSQDFSLEGGYCKSASLLMIVTNQSIESLALRLYFMQ